MVRNDNYKKKRNTSRTTSLDERIKSREVSDLMGALAVNL
jgi:hypothetical protein